MGSRLLLAVVDKGRDGKIERGRLLLECVKEVFRRSERGRTDVENEHTCVGDWEWVCFQDI